MLILLDFICRISYIIFLYSYKNRPYLEHGPHLAHDTIWNRMRSKFFNIFSVRKSNDIDKLCITKLFSIKIHFRHFYSIMKFSYRFNRSREKNPSDKFNYTHLPKYSFCRNIDEFFCTQYSDKQLVDDHRKLY